MKLALCILIAIILASFDVSLGEYFFTYLSLFFIFLNIIYSLFQEKTRVNPLSTTCVLTIIITASMGYIYNEYTYRQIAYVINELNNNPENYNQIIDNENDKALFTQKFYLIKNKNNCNFILIYKKFKFTFSEQERQSKCINLIS